MKFQFFITLIVAAIITATFSNLAHARRTPIPCTGDRLVKVVDIADLKGPDGTQVDLGYKFSGCFGDGEWIGYLGKSDSYLPLNDERTKVILTAAGLSELPSPPSRLASFDAFFLEWLLVGVLLLFVLWELAIKPLFRRTR